MIKWTKLEGSDVWRGISGYINGDDRRYYHNMDHVKACYEYLDKISAPYNRGLDYAVLIHDTFYDNFGNLEERSCQEFLFAAMENGLDRRELMIGVECILATRDHTMTKGMSEYAKNMIRADLSGFMLDDRTVLKNFHNIKKENMAIHPDLSEYKFHVETGLFLHGLIDRIGTMRDEFPDDYRRIKIGIKNTIFCSEHIRNSKKETDNNTTQQNKEEVKMEKIDTNHTWRFMEYAKKDGTIYRLLVPKNQYDLNAYDDGMNHGVTIGYNNYDNDGQDVWVMIGWDWNQSDPSFIAVADVDPISFCKL